MFTGIDIQGKSLNFVDGKSRQTLIPSNTSPLPNLASQGIISQNLTGSLNGTLTEPTQRFSSNSNLTAAESLRSQLSNQRASHRHTFQQSFKITKHQKLLLLKQNHQQHIEQLRQSIVAQQQFGDSSLHIQPCFNDNLNSLLGPPINNRRSFNITQQTTPPPPPLSMKITSIGMSQNETKVLQLQQTNLLTALSASSKPQHKDQIGLRIRVDDIVSEHLNKKSPMQQMTTSAISISNPFFEEASEEDYDSGEVCENQGGTTPSVTMNRGRSNRSNVYFAGNSNIQQQQPQPQKKFPPNLNLRQNNNYAAQQSQLKREKDMLYKAGAEEKLPRIQLKGKEGLVENKVDSTTTNSFTTSLKTTSRENSSTRRKLLNANQIVAMLAAGKAQQQQQLQQQQRVDSQGGDEIEADEVIIAADLEGGGEYEAIGENEEFEEYQNGGGAKDEGKSPLIVAARKKIKGEEKKQQQQQQQQQLQLKALEASVNTVTLEKNEENADVEKQKCIRFFRYNQASLLHLLGKKESYFSSLAAKKSIKTFSNMKSVNGKQEVNGDAKKQQGSPINADYFALLDRTA